MKKYTGDFDKDLKILMPEVIADSVAGMGNQELADKLAEKARIVYKHNPTWAKKITDTEKGRDTLYAFMEHWKLGYDRTGKV